MLHIHCWLINNGIFNSPSTFVIDENMSLQWLPNIKIFWLFCEGSLVLYNKIYLY